MVTHNLRYAIEYEDRLLIFHEGEIVLDKKYSEKEKLKLEDILDRFNAISLERGNSI